MVREGINNFSPKSSSMRYESSGERSQITDNAHCSVGVSSPAHLVNWIAGTFLGIKPILVFSSFTTADMSILL